MKKNCGNCFYYLSDIKICDNEESKNYNDKIPANSNSCVEWIGYCNYNYNVCIGNERCKLCSHYKEEVEF